MRKQLAILLVFAFIFSLVPINLVKAITQNQINAEVQIVCPDDYGNWFSGSGTIIDPKGIILTNKHVVTDGKGGIIKYCIIGIIESINKEPNFGTKENLNISETKYYTSTTDMDAAILYINNPTNKIYTYVDIWNSDSNTLQFGNKIETIGFPSIGGSTITYTSGDFSGFGSTSDDTQNYLKTTAILEHGNSGGAAYNSNGQFIGIPTMVVSGTLNSMGYILSANSIKNWLSGFLGNQYKQEVIEQQPTIAEQPKVNLQNDITPPNVSTFKLGYNVFVGSWMGDRGIGSRFIEPFDDIRFYWVEDCSGVYRKECLYDVSGIKGYYYYFGKDPQVNPVAKGTYSEDIQTNKEGYKIIPNHFKMDSPGTYYFIISFIDGANNISAPYIFEYIFQKDLFKEINSIHFYSDSKYTQSLGYYNYKFENVQWGLDDTLTCKTKLNNLYFSIEYPASISHNGYIYDFKQFYGQPENGKYTANNKFSLADISKSKKGDLIVFYEKKSYLSPESYYFSLKTGDDKVPYNSFYFKPFTNQDNKLLDNKHKIMDIVYDSHMKEDFSCSSRYDRKYKNPEYSVSCNNVECYMDDRYFTSLEKDYTDLTFASKLKGYILLQVESQGKAWYVNIVDGKRYYMADGATAYQLMRKFGVGITNANLAKIPKEKEKNNNPSLVNKMKGKILLQVESHGEAWYVNPKTGYRYYMKDGDAAYNLMRYYSLGISNKDLEKIPEGSL